MARHAGRAAAKKTTAKIRWFDYFRAPSLKEACVGGVLFDVRRVSCSAEFWISL
jgi:hypothetical protein